MKPRLLPEYEGPLARFRRRVFFLLEEYAVVWALVGMLALYALGYWVLSIWDTGGWDPAGLAQAWRCSGGGPGDGWWC